MDQEEFTRSTIKKMITGSKCRLRVGLLTCILMRVGARASQFVLLFKIIIP